MRAAEEEKGIRAILGRKVPAGHVPLIERMVLYREPEVSCSRFFGIACFTEESLHAYRAAQDPSAFHLLEHTELGTYVAGQISGGLFVDVPCGLLHPADPAEDFAMVPLAAALGVRRCFEVDLSAEVLQGRLPEKENVMDAGGRYTLAAGVGQIGVRTECGLSIATMQDDLLGFIAKISGVEEGAPKALYLSGIQPDADFCRSEEVQRTVAVPYLTALYRELARACRPGDLVILNSSDMLAAGIDEALFPGIHPALALPQEGFSLVRRCLRNKVQVFRKG